MTEIAPFPALTSVQQEFARSAEVSDAPTRRPAILICLKRNRAGIGGVEWVVRALEGYIPKVRPDWAFAYASAFGRPGGFEHVPVLGDLVASMRLARRALISAPDVVVVHGGEHVWAIRAARRLWKRRFAIVCVWHGDGPRAARMSRRSGNIAAWLLARYLRTLCGLALRADAHIAVHEHVVEEIRTEWDFRGPIAVGHNALETSLQLRLNGQPKQRRPDFVCLWIGQVAYRKGFDVALAACALARDSIPSLRLVIAGVSSPGTLPTWVDQRGQLSPEQTLSLYAEADVMVFPSRYEGFSTVLLEAMGAGMPIVCAQDFGDGILVDGRNGFLIRGYDPRDYARAIRALYHDPEMRDRMGANSARDVRRFSWTATAAAYAEVVDRLLRTHPSSRNEHSSSARSSVHDLP